MRYLQKGVLDLCTLLALLTVTAQASQKDAKNGMVDSGLRWKGEGAARRGLGKTLHRHHHIGGRGEDDSRPPVIHPSSLEHRDIWKRFEGEYRPTGNNMGEEESGVVGEVVSDNCTHPRQPLPRYNNSCDFVHAECGGKAELIDYLAFVLCDLPRAQVGGEGRGRGM